MYIYTYIYIYNFIYLYIVIHIYVYIYIKNTFAITCTQNTIYCLISFSFAQGLRKCWKKRFVATVRTRKEKPTLIWQT